MSTAAFPFSQNKAFVDEHKSGKKSLKTQEKWWDLSPSCCFVSLHTLLPPPPLYPSGELELCVGSPLIGCRAVFGSAVPGFPEPEPGVGGTDKASTVVAQRRPSCEETVCCASGGRSPDQSRPRGMMSSHCVLYVSQLPTHMRPWSGECVSSVLLSQLVVKLRQ